MTGITMNTQEYAELTGLVDTAVELFGKPTPLLKAWAVVLQQDHLKRFAAGGSPTPWKPLAPSTRAARRQGKGAISGALPLQGLRGTFDVVIKGNSVVLGTDSPVAIFHHEGTQGPYEIKPKSPDGTLALPYYPERDGQKGGSARTGKAGSKTLSGLGKGRRNAAGKIISGPGTKRAGKVTMPFSNLAFYKHVTHPGLAARPLLPTPEDILPRLVEVGEAFLDHVAKG